MTFEAHKQEPDAAKNRPWLEGVYSDDLLDWLEDRLGGVEAERAPTTVAMLQFHKQVNAYAPLSSAYIPPLQWVMDAFRRDTYNAGMYGSARKFLNDLESEAIKNGGVLNAYAMIQQSPALWGAVQWRTEEIYRYGDKFLEGMQPGDPARGLIVAEGMARSGLAPEDWLISFWEHFKANIDRYSSARRLTRDNWEKALTSLASAPNLPESVVREMMERMTDPATGYTIRENLLSSLIWNETALSPEVYLEFLGKGSKSSVRFGVDSEAIPYHGTASLEELRELTGLRPNLKSNKVGRLYDNLSTRFDQGAIWKKSVQKIRNSENALSTYGGVANHWFTSYMNASRTGQYVRLSRVSDHVYLAREGTKFREAVAETQLAGPSWSANRVLALPAVGERLKTVRAAASSSGLDEDGNIPLDWLLEVLG